MRNKIVIITGLPASGKTTIGKELAKRMNILFLSKDDIKELMFDGLGWKDREWSKKIGLMSYDMLYYFSGTLLKVNTSFMLESNFKPEFDNPKFVALKEKYDFDVIQILCKADGEVLFERFKKRSESGQRHPGHVDTTNYDEFKNALLTGRCESLALEGKIIEIDTTDFDKVDISALLEQMNAE